MSVKKFVVGLLATNCYIYQDEKTGRCAVIDPGAKSEQLFEAVKQIGEDKFDYILLTHCHFDHVGGVSALKELTGATVAIHEDDAKGLQDSDKNVSGFFSCKMLYDKADKTFTDGEKFSIGETEFTVLHTPGHSEGSCCYVTEGLIFSGDTLFKRSAGRTDMPGGSYEKLLVSMQRLAALQGDYLVYPGHDMQTTLSDEIAHNPYFKADEFSLF